MQSLYRVGLHCVQCPYHRVVPRWTEDTPERLQRAAVELFLERGYDQVTVAEIAERAGLTRRSFFNHFTEKREIFFAGAGAFQAHVVDHIAASPPDCDPFQAATAALASGGVQIARMAGNAARPVRTLIAASAELREREFAKMAAVTSAIADALARRGAPARAADLAARTAVTVFTVAFDDWIDAPGTDLTELMHVASNDLCQVLSAAPSP